MRETITNYITYSTVVYEKFEDGAKIEYTTVEEHIYDKNGYEIKKTR